MSPAPWPPTACKKKLYALHPQRPPVAVEIQRTQQRRRVERLTPLALENQVRQLLADKVSGNLVGLWLLVPEYLRLGVWDLLCGWTGAPGAELAPRLAFQLVNEAALCVRGLRHQRSLSQKGFELVHGLPFVASDQAIHDLLAAHTVAQGQALQVALGRLRRASGHFQGRLLVVDPHRLKSFSQRQMRRRQLDRHRPPCKASQTFFCLDAQPHTPVCATLGTAARTVAQATPELLALAQTILEPGTPAPLVLADSEHFTAELIDQVKTQTAFDLLVPLPHQPAIQRALAALPAAQFTPQWAGLAIAKGPYQLADGRTGPYYQLVQRCGERPDEYTYKGFLCTTGRPAADALCLDFPQRWHIEEFFNRDQALGWQRAGTLNLNIRFGQLSLALIAQAALHQMRARIGAPVDGWDAPHLAQAWLGGLEGDVRIQEDTILVTYYNAPQAAQWHQHYQGLPARLQAENINPRIPWLYDLKLDFRFR